MKNKLVEFRKNNREEGLSLVEILVAIALLSVVSIIVVSLINTTMNSASRFSNVTSSQAEVSTATSSLQRDISTANQVIKATDRSLLLRVRSDSKDYEVMYFAFDKSDASNIPAGVDVASLPPYSALIQLRREVGSTTFAQNVVIKQLVFEKTSQIFKFYDSQNAEVTGVPTLSSGGSASQNTLSDVKRIEFNLSAKADGRGTPIQMASSAVVNSSTVSPSTVGGPNDPYANNGVPQCVSQFKVAIDSVNSPRTAVLTWYPSAGATSYTIYRQDVTSGASTTPAISTIVSNPAERQLTQTENDGITWGRTYVWSFQVNGPGGTTGVCTTTQATIVPDQIQFANINSLAQLASTKNGSAAETLTRAGEPGIAVKTKSTESIVSGQRYTVARNLTNQLSWENGVVGTTGYKVYDATNMSTPVATITTAGTLYAQVPSVYGAERDYIVRAYNAGGESQRSDSVKLISPPSASAFTSRDPDTSTNSTTTITDFTLTRRANNTDGFRGFKNEAVATASTDMCVPTSWPAATSLNFEANSAIKDDNQAIWGTNGCYRYVPFNDAGNGVAATTTVLHKPGKFTFTNVTNPSTMRVIDTNRDLNGNPGSVGVPFCWSDRDGNAGSLAGDWNCKGDSKQVRGDAYAPIGMFGTVSNSRLSIYVSWNQSYNAFNDYTVTRNRIASGNQQDQNAVAVQTHTIPYVNGGQAVKYNNEQPGSIFEFTVTGKAQNGLTRDRKTQTLTRPDIPASMMGNYWVRTNLGDSGTTRGTKVITQANLSAAHGMVDSIRWVTDFPGAYGGTVVQDVAANGSTVGLSSNFQTVTGKNYRGLSTLVTRNITVDSGSIVPGESATRTITVTQQSDEIGRFGELAGFACPSGGSGNCSSGDGASWPWGWPTYWTGGPARYWAGGDAATGFIEIGNQNSIEAPPFTAGGGNDANSCQNTVEDTAGFTTNCTYGNGVPPTPNVTITQSGTTQTATWNSWNAVTQYRVTYSINGAAPSTATRSATNRSVAFTVPVGQKVVVSVVAVNSANESDPGTAEAVTAPAIPTNVAATAGTDKTSIKVSWTNSSGATSYNIYYSRNGGATKKVSNATSPATITGLTAGTYTVRVDAVAAGVASDQSAAQTVTLNPTSPPPAPTNVVADTSAKIVGRADLRITGSDLDAKYDIKVTNGSTTTTLSDKTCDSSVTTYCAISLTGLTKGTTTFSVSAKNAAGSSAFVATSSSTNVTVY